MRMDYWLVMGSKLMAAATEVEGEDEKRERMQGGLRRGEDEERARESGEGVGRLGA